MRRLRTVAISASSRWSHPECSGSNRDCRAAHTEALLPRAIIRDLRVQGGAFLPAMAESSPLGLESAHWNRSPEEAEDVRSISRSIRFFVRCILIGEFSGR
jgi:hypothetical protein